MCESVCVCVIKKKNLFKTKSSQNGFVAESPRLPAQPTTRPQCLSLAYCLQHQLLKDLCDMAGV